MMFTALMVLLLVFQASLPIRATSRRTGITRNLSQLATTVMAKAFTILKDKEKFITHKTLGINQVVSTLRSK
jgi:hypothetical protein